MTRQELLRDLFKKYNLSYDADNPESKDNDVYKHKHYTCITRGGIQKIEKAALIACDLQIVSAGRDFCIIKGIAYTPDGKSYTTFASASDLNSTNKYFAEMAEKRCRSRLILTLAGLYELGIFGEDEIDETKSGVVKTSMLKVEQ